MTIDNCPLCDELIAEDDETIEGLNFVAHRECLYREVMGGIGHHEDHEFWCLVVGDPDGGRTPRQSALEVWGLEGRITPIVDHES